MTHALIIDDDTSNLGVLKELLTLEGISFTAVQDATVVEDMLLDIGHIDVVLLDLEMPDIDGYQMFELLSSYPEMRGVPIVACTVHTNELPNARDLGFYSFISKPLDADKFGNQLANILNGTPVWSAY